MHSERMKAAVCFEKDQPVRIEATAEDALAISVANAGEPIPPSARERLSLIHI